VCLPTFLISILASSTRCTICVGNWSKCSYHFCQGGCQSCRFRVSSPIPYFTTRHSHLVLLSHSLDEKKANLVVEEIRKFGGDAIAVGGDVSAEDFPKKIMDATISKYGKLNHIINNGVYRHVRPLFEVLISSCAGSWVHLRQDAPHNA
jgi:hypothetical protein